MKDWIKIVICALIIVLLVIGINKAALNTEYDLALKAYKQRDLDKAHHYITMVYNSDKNFRDVKEYYKKIKYDYQIKKGDEFFKEQNYNSAKNEYKTALEISNTDEINEKIKLADNEIKKIELAKKAKIEAEKKAKAAKINKLKQNMRFRYDKVEDITFIQDKTSSRYVDTNSFFLYIAKFKTGSNIWLRISYTGDDWIFFDTITFNIDGQKKDIYLNYYDVVRDNNNGVVWEYINLKYDDNKDLINEIIKSKSAIMRLSGKNYHHDKTISNSEKQALKRVLEYYNIINE